MLFLNKLLPVFVLPVGILVLLLAVAAWRGWRWLTAATALLLLAGSFPVVANQFLRPLENRYPARSVGTMAEADAVIVLGGFMSGTKEVGLVQEWSDAVERFEAGVALAKAGKVRMLLFTGDPRGSEGSAARREAILRGVPAAQIETLGWVGNTADEAAALRRYAKEKGFKRVVLVTSAWHLPRAMLQFRKAGVEIVPFPVDYRALPSTFLSYMDFIPTANGLEKIELAMRETYGIAFYSLFGD